MNIRCDQCRKKNKGRYKSFLMEFEVEGKVNSRHVTMCYDCLDSPLPTGRTDKQMFEHISTPFWIHAGLKPKPHEAQQMKYMKSRGMSWGDLRKERYANVPKANTGVNEFQQHVDRYGRKNAPDPSFGKESN